MHFEDIHHHKQIMPIGRKARHMFGALALGLAVTFSGASMAQDAGQDAAPTNADEMAKVADGSLTIDRIFKDREFSPERGVASKWFNGGDQFTIVKKSETVEGGFDIVQRDIASDSSTVLVKAEQLIPESAEKPLKISNYQWSDDGNLILISTNTKQFRRTRAFGDYWVLNLKTGDLKQIAKDATPSTLMYGKFSPDSKSVAYVRENNIYAQSLESGETVQLTSDGNALVVNGLGDWVNEEEFSLRDGFRWSPDSKRIAYWQFDTEGVGTFYMIKNTDDNYSKPIPLQYPKAGTTNSAMRVGTVDLASSTTVWIDLPGDKRQNYVPRMSWAESSDQVILQYMNRLQNTNQVILANVADGTHSTIFTDKDDAWVDVNADPKWLDGGKKFTWLSERDGWRHLYLISRDGKKVKLLSPGEFDIIRVQNIDTKGGWVYYTASPKDNAARYLFRSPLKGRAKVERLTPQGQDGTHSYRVAPNSNFAFHSYSNFVDPGITELISLPDHKSVRSIVDNQELKEKFGTIDRGEHKFFTVDIGDGVEMDGWMMTPPSFDPSKKYPMLMYVYGEPAGQTVLNRWGGDRYLWHLMMSQLGYVVVSVDGHGTPAPKGRDWRKSIYGQIGLLASSDHSKATLGIIRDFPFVDAERVGIWGWSGGGSMTLNAMFRYPDIYSMGVSVAPVTDQTLYDSIYQERYMGLPEDNKEGYHDGSVIHFADQLEGDLLLVHGTGDDNVHYQNTEQLVDKLIEHNKQFTVMMYPDRSHGIFEKKNTRRHLFGLMKNYVVEHLPTEPAMAE